MDILRKFFILFLTVYVLAFSIGYTQTYISRDSVMSIASSYCYAVWTANSGNSNNTPNPNNPGWNYNDFTVGQVVTGIDYEWGGYDTLSACLAKLYAGATAGDSYDVIEYPSKYWTGVDCSGYASRCWQTSTRYVTSTFYEICSTINYADLYRGDLYDYQSVHCRIFDSFVPGTNYYMDYESPGDYVGVTYEEHSQDNNYTPFRYLYITPFNPPTQINNWELYSSNKTN